ncbi:TPA: hypothetical protein MOX26_004820 [Salmonella enterica subsp. enterica serovar Ball]|uniref:ZirS family two-partner secretion-like system exoprotein n=1 Tax=Salmonella enterica TaxID=28901 RepID=UPI0012C84703|nr:ZirS family two-partner secretion-like system exoprotein [Salmonella enterica]EBW4675559.1 hypothetical protein [Salmonella enterica subsp. salamae serovar Sofia]HCA3433404.1 hypothetical protein [Salmonella enterica subsp. enterica serovar Ball]EAO6408825.1 hypothetical protein [Salmonella enterica]ECJ2534813.1 hypothetical protein [Salmonella enterica subsp. salamae serovar Sofia]EJF4694383.1 hypothetical protein [Salmonella enterica]
MSKHNLIIYSLLLAAVPISVSADSSTTSAATVGIFSSPTAPSVGHRPEKNIDGYRLELSGTEYFSDLRYAPFPGLTMARADRAIVHDPDNNYQASETFTTVCTYYQVNKDSSQHIFKRERPCKYKIDIKKEHVGAKIKLEIYNETDITSAPGYTPVPSMSEFSYVETKTISNTPSRDLTVMNIDNTILSPGESATITTIVKDIDGNPINDAMIDLYIGRENNNGLWDIGPVKKGSNPGEYKQIITYLGSRSERIDVTYKYHGDVFRKSLSIRGRL